MKLLSPASNVTDALSLQGSLLEFIGDRVSWLLDMIGRWLLDTGTAFIEWLSDTGTAFTEWLSQPHIWILLLVWVCTFTVTIVILFVILYWLGFGPIGVILGSCAAAFQAYMYGGFTPAGGLFATLTSIGMLGWATPTVAVVAAAVASIATAIAWACGLGK